MFEDAPEAGPRYQAWTAATLHRIPQVQALSEDQQLAIKTVAQVLPFRVNQYVVDELIDWSKAPDDPMFRLTFPQEEMLDADDFAAMRDLVAADAPRGERKALANEIRAKLNPHPAGQTTKNVPTLHGEKVPGIQHKYRETVLVFPSAGQTCHAYCTYCFRWAQFIGDADLRFAAKEIDPIVEYLRTQPDVTDVLFTGGDPMIMKTKVLRRYIEPLLEIDHIKTIRIGTKSVAWWPHRFVTDADADDLMELFGEIVASGKHLALMGHYSHPRELSTPMAAAAIRRIRSTGAVVRCQAPLVRHVNDDPEVWADMWRRQVALGAVPYYMFMERDTGPRGYFEVPIARALDIYTEAVNQVSGLARTVRGPSMSCTPGKVQVVGTTGQGEKKRFLLRFLQGRDPGWVNEIFFAKYSDSAAWIDQLEPFFEDGWFFEPDD